MAKILSMSLLGNKLYLEFDEAMTSVSANTSTFDLGSTNESLGINSLSGDSTASWVITLDASIPSSDYLKISGLGSLAKSTTTGAYLNDYTTYALGTVHGTTLDFSLNSGNVSKIILGNGADIVSVSGADRENIDLSETVKSIDAVRFVDNGVFNFQDSNDIRAFVFVEGFDVSNLETNDKLDLPSAKIAANVTNFNGIDVGTIASHSIVDGIATFKDSLGNDVIIDTDTEVLQATQYLNKNIVDAGVTAAFNFNFDTDNYGLGVFQKGALNSDYSLGIGLGGLTGITLSNTAGVNKVQIVDSTGPQMDHVQAGGKGIDAYFSETVNSASVSGLHLYKNGLTDMGGLTTTVNGSIVSINSSQNLAATDFVVAAIDPMFSYQATDVLGNTSNSNDFFVSARAYGGAGDNVIDLSTLAGVMRALGGGGDDTIKASTRGGEILNGEDGNDTLVGSIRALAYTTLIGGNGNDILDSGAGYSNMDGGAGNDTYIVRTYGGTYLENSDSGVDLVQSYVQYLALNSNVENLRIMSTGAANGTGNELNNIIYAGAGNNVIDGGGGIDSVSYASAISGVTVDLSLTTAQATGGSGTDTLLNIENLYGSNYNDVITSSSVSNKIYGLGGNDSIAVAAGNSADYLDGGVGIDTISYSRATAGVSIYLSLTGAQNTIGSGTDTILNFENAFGSGYNDVLSGNSLSNVLNGLNGNDVINGGLGNDTLTGGAGYDTFVFNTTLSAMANRDLITDFSPVYDTIKLENGIFTKLTAVGALAAGNFCANTSGMAVDSNDFVCYNTTTPQISYDADGNGAGASVAFAVLGTSAHPVLTVADFVVF